MTTVTDPDAVRRAALIDDLHAFADWLQTNADVPTPYDMYASYQLNSPDTDPSAHLAQLREFAARFGATIDESLHDRTRANVTLGRLQYRLLVWHPQGRPGVPDARDVELAALRAEVEKLRATSSGAVTEGGLVDETEAPRELLAIVPTADGMVFASAPVGSVVDPVQRAKAVGLTEAVAAEQERERARLQALRWKREVTRHGGNTAALEHARDLALIEDNDRATARVTAWMTPADEGRIANPDLARFLAEREDRRREPASGLTPAADRSRGALAGTTPVVVYFSFGHGQRDPRTGKKLLDHYATVVAPTYEACREAMFGRNWSFDYLAGTETATEWIPRWTEHEVIVAPGTDPVLAEAALTAARDLLAPASAE